MKPVFPVQPAPDASAIAQWSFRTFLLVQSAFAERDIPTRYTAAQLADVAALCNTQKQAGEQVWDSTNLRPLWAQGAATTAPWVDASGTAVITPA